jgi:large subunit ribosomal protein LP2
LIESGIVLYVALKLYLYISSNMIEVAALLLCKLGGQGGSADEIKAVLEAAGVPVDEEALTKLTGDMDGKDLNELLAAGAEKIKDVPFGGGGGGGAPGR